MTPEARAFMVEAYRTVERYGRRKPTVRMITLMARQVGYKIRDSEAYALLQPFKDRAEAGQNSTDETGRTFAAPRQNIASKNGRSLAAASRARGKGITCSKDLEEGYTLFGDAGATEVTSPPKKTKKHRDAAVYNAIDAIWKELEPQASRAYR